MLMRRPGAEASVSDSSNEETEPNEDSDSPKEETEPNDEDSDSPNDEDSDSDSPNEETEPNDEDSDSPNDEDSDSPNEETEPVMLLEEALELLAKRPEAFARRHHRPWFGGNLLHYKKPQSTDRAAFEYPHAIDLLRHLICAIFKTRMESLGSVSMRAAERGMEKGIISGIKRGIESVYGRGTARSAVASRRKSALGRRQESTSESLTERGSDWEREIESAVGRETESAVGRTVESAVGTRTGVADSGFVPAMSRRLKSAMRRGLKSAMVETGTSLELASHILGRQLCTAVQFGNYEVAREIIGLNPLGIWYRNEEDQHSIFEIAALNRQEKVFELLYILGPFKHYLLPTKDNAGNNILHLAARRQPLLTSSAALQVQRDLHWFKEMEKFVQPSFRNQNNNAGKTPREVFIEEHEELLKEGDKWMKKTAQSCTVVAALVVTVVFAAAFTVPGGNNDSNGIPNYLTDASFMTFAISDTLGLVSSTTSLLIFLSILSSRFSEGDLLNTGQYTSLSIGLVTLFFSIASMLVTFTASLRIVLGHRVKWIAFPIGILASVPLILFAWLQFPLVVEIVHLTFQPFFFAGRKVRHYWTFPEISCSWEEK